ncbi:UbiA family prenyltransferase, partial [Candidatus Peregrinibacteria bacterium]|nr:UbiA family prenyltransferase [Candidatus Peregrinibacteria bacterium]
PIKKNRPIASGEIQKSKALILAVILLAVTATLSLSFPQKVLIALTSYLTINLLYSLWLKHVVIIDIFLIASLYLIRIFAGGKLWDIYISHWLMLCTFFLALFLISAKRRAEFCQQDENTNSTRKVIKSYNKIFLDHMLTITTTSSLVGYSLYVVNAEQPYFLYSVIFVAFGLFRYLYVVCQYNIGQFPEKVIFTDPWIFSSIALWGTYSLIVLYVI